MGRDLRRAALAALAVATLMAPFAARAQEGSDESGDGPRLAVERAAIARDVVDREPVGEGTAFPADVGRLACFTKITGAENETVIHHVWLLEDEEKARVELPVRASSWRTFSRKEIPPEWTGRWAVQVEGAGGRVLTRLEFTVGDSGEEEERGGDAAGGDNSGR